MFLQKNKVGKLPLKKLPLMADMKIRTRIFLRSWQRTWQQISFLFIVKRMAVVTLSLLVFISSAGLGTTAYAYNAVSVTPESVLYDVKRGVEDYVLERKTASEDRALYYMDLSERRLEEADYLSEEDASALFINQAYADETVDVGESIVEGLLVESTNFQTLALEEVQTLSDAEVIEPLVEKIHTRIERHEPIFGRLEERIKDRRPETFETFKSLREDHKNSLSSFQKEMKKSRGSGNEKVFFDFDPRWMEINGKDNRPPKLEKMKERMDRMKMLAPMHRLPVFPLEDQQQFEEHKEQVKQLLREGEKEKARKLVEQDRAKMDKFFEDRKKDFQQQRGAQKIQKDMFEDGKRRLDFERRSEREIR